VHLSTFFTCHVPFVLAGRGFCITDIHLIIFLEQWNLWGYCRLKLWPELGRPGMHIQFWWEGNINMDIGNIGWVWRVEMLLGWSNKGRWDGWVMYHTSVRGEMHTKFWLGNLKGRYHLVDIGGDGNILLQRILGKRWSDVDLMHLAQDRDQWKAVVNKVKSLRVS
jgi:hypothetical protein